MPVTGTVDAANARIDLFVDYTTVPGTQLFATLYRRVGDINAPDEYVRGLYGTTLLGEQAYVSDHEAPLDRPVWYVAVAGPDTSAPQVAGPFTIPSSGYVWMKDPGRPWADLRLDLCRTPTRAITPDCPPLRPAVYDTFSRTVVDGWGTSDSGHLWQLSPLANAPDFDVAGGVGTIGVNAVNTTRRALTPATFLPTDVDLKVLAGPGVLANGGNVETTLMARIDPADIGNTYYYGEVEYNFQASRTVRARIVRRQAGVDTALSTAIDVSNFTYTAASRYWVRFLLIGSVLRLKIWPENSAEVDEWAVTVTDTALTSGRTGVRTTVDPGNVNPLPVVTTWDSFTASIPVAATDDLAWVGLADKTRAMDAGLFPVLNKERPADVYARRKDIVSAASFLSRSLDAVDLVYELYTAGGPLLFQIPEVYGWKDTYVQPGNLNEQWISNDQRKPWRLWNVPITAVDVPIGLPQGTDTANWCAVEDTYPTFADMTAAGYSWGQAASGAASVVPTVGLYGGGTYGSGIYGG